MGLFGFGKKEQKTEDSPADKLKHVFCMWKPTKKDPDFSNSKIVKLISRLFDASEENELLYFNGYRKLLGMPKLEHVPTKEVYIGMQDANVQFIISLSHDKGLRYRFDYEAADIKGIENVLSVAVNMMEKARIEFKKLKTGNHNNPTNGKKWWEGQKMIDKEHKDKKLLAIGMLLDLSKVNAV